MSQMMKELKLLRECAAGNGWRTHDHILIFSLILATNGPHLLFQPIRSNIQLSASLRVRLFLEQFGIRSCVLNSELPANIRIHIISQFNKGSYDIIIASDEHMLEKPSGKKQRMSKHADLESSASRGIDFQGVNNIINFDFPRDVTSYIHRAGRTARGKNKGSVLSFVSVKEVPVNKAVEEKLRSCFGKETLPKMDTSAPIAETALAADVDPNNKSVAQLRFTFADVKDRPQKEQSDEIIKYVFQCE